MNKTVIRDFAISARKKLIASVKDKTGKIGITIDNIMSPITKGEGFAVFPTDFGMETTLTGKELIQRDNLISRIKEKGYDSVMEEVAYTWFNRLIAVRFMEVNDYLPTRVRVLSSETRGKLEPDMITKAPNINLKLTEEEKDEVINLKMKNQMDSLFQMLFIKQCNALGEILPELFENTSKDNKDYTEILLGLSYTNEDSVIRDLLKIEEEDFLDAVEIIGWMYQYYNTEPKEETFALLKKNVKITKGRIPSATQLFTPDWIVRYMVENSLGRLWLEGHKDASLKINWEYYLDEAEQEPEVEAQLEVLRADAKNIAPEDIKIIDPCMGSGHILVYTFEVLMQIYESCGYTQRDAARLIIERNLYGLDIDDRALQLAYFAVMMKGRKYNRRILTMGIAMNLCGIQESNVIKSEIVDFMANGDTQLQKKAQILLDLFIDAKEYGSILEIPNLNFDDLKKRVKEIGGTVYDNIIDRIYQEEVLLKFAPLLKQAEILAEKHDVVVTNPPYLGSRGMGKKLADFVKKNYPNSKNDLFAVFMEQCEKITRKNGFNALITMQSWMFLSSYYAFRKYYIGFDCVNMLHLGSRAFEDAVGTIVQTTTFVIRKTDIKEFKGNYHNLCEDNLETSKETNFFKKNNENKYSISKNDFFKIPNLNYAYWISENVKRIFKESKYLYDYGKTRQGMATSDNNRFIRIWHEINFENIEFNCTSESRKSELK